jgi:hypothetical protein
MLMCAENGRAVCGCTDEIAMWARAEKMRAALCFLNITVLEDLSPFLFCWWTCQTITTLYQFKILFSHGRFFFKQFSIPLLLMITFLQTL